MRNLWNLLRETDAGRSLGGKVASLGEDLADAAGSEIGRQCLVDATVSAIRLLESLRTPEVKKALLDQWAVGTCRLVDALASGKGEAGILRRRRGAVGARRGGERRGDGSESRGRMRAGVLRVGERAGEPPDEA